MKTPKKPGTKAKGTTPIGAKTGIKTTKSKPVQNLEDEDDEFEEPLEDVDFDSLNNFDEDDDY